MRDWRRLTSEPWSWSCPVTRVPPPSPPGTSPSTPLVRSLSSDLPRSRDGYCPQCFSLFNKKKIQTLIGSGSHPVFKTKLTYLHRAVIRFFKYFNLLLQNLDILTQINTILYFCEGIPICNKIFTTQADNICRRNRVIAMLYLTVK